MAWSTALRTALSGACLLAVAVAAPAAPTEETIVFVRHGEKPDGGLGQLDCQGLNRALALPAMVQASFGRPDFVFASNPADTKVDGQQPYNYIRPLLTVAPTAVRFGLPVNTAYGYEDIAGLQRELMLPAYRSARVLVGWEHKQLEQLVRRMLQDLGADAGVVPHWKGADFDSVYVLTITRDGDTVTARFALARERLDGQSTVCPVPAPQPR